MKKDILSKIAIIACGIVLIGCSTLPKPTNERNVLVIGEINVINNDTHYNNLPSTFKAGIKITLRSIETNKSIDVTSNNEGLFFTEKLQAGIYEIMEFSFVKQSGNTTYQTSTPEHWKYFVVKENKINNLGLIIWTMADRNWIVDYTEKYDSVKKLFDGKYSKSEWNNAKWANLGYPLCREDQDNSLMQQYIVRNDDVTRYQELWVFWNLIARQQVKSYPIPLKNETAYDWMLRNFHTVKGAKFGDIELSFTVAPGEKNEEKLKPLQIKALMPENSNRLELSTLLFSYKDGNGNNLSSIFVAW